MKEVRVGMRFRANDPKRPREVEVVEVEGSYAFVKNVVTGLTTRVGLSAFFKTKQRGFSEVVEGVQDLRESGSVP